MPADKYEIGLALQGADGSIRIDVKDSNGASFSIDIDAGGLVPLMRRALDESTGRFTSGPITVRVHRRAGNKAP